jgi:hypothetical protein
MWKIAALVSKCAVLQSACANTPCRACGATAVADDEGGAGGTLDTAADDLS